jgi:hypothetical protein
MTPSYALSRLIGWWWADGATCKGGFTVPARRLSARAKHTRQCATAVGWTVTRTPPIVGARLRVAIPPVAKWAPDIPRWEPELAKVEDPRAALASIIECEGSTAGLLCDDKHDARLDECEALLGRLLLDGGWKRTAWRDGGGALWVTTAEALAVVQSLPYVATGRVPTKIAGG